MSVVWPTCCHMCSSHDKTTNPFIFILTPRRSKEKKSHAHQTKEQVEMQTTFPSQHSEQLALVPLNSENNQSSL